MLSECHAQHHHACDLARDLARDDEGGGNRRHCDETAQANDHDEYARQCRRAGTVPMSRLWRAEGRANARAVGCRAALTASRCASADGVQKMDIDWVGVVIGLVLAIPLSIAANLLTPRWISFLEKRKLIKRHKTRQQALQIYNRIRAFKEGRRDKYPFYLLLASSAVICAIAASTITSSSCLFHRASKSTLRY
jgi:hypothetical protein